MQRKTSKTPLSIYSSRRGRAVYTLIKLYRFLRSLTPNKKKEPRKIENEKSWCHRSVWRRRGKPSDATPTLTPARTYSFCVCCCRSPFTSSWSRNLFSFWCSLEPNRSARDDANESDKQTPLLFCLFTFNFSMWLALTLPWRWCVWRMKAAHLPLVGGNDALRLFINN